MAAVPPPRPTIDFDATELNRRLRRMKRVVPRRYWRWIWRDLTRYTLSLQRKRVRAQTNPDGTPFEKRRKGKRKMLAKTLKAASHALVMRYDEDGGSLTISNKVTLKHHFGHTEKIKPWTAEQIAKYRGVRSDSPCTKEQAQKLRGIFKKRMSLKTIREKYNASRAGAIIRRDEDSRAVARSEIVIQLPERRVLGFGRGDVRLIVDKLEALMIRYINRSR